MAVASQRNTFPIGEKTHALPPATPRTPQARACVANVIAVRVPQPVHTLSGAFLSRAALGVRIAGVDDATYSQTGEAYSTVALPETDVHTSRTLQEEDTSLAYEA